MNNVLTVLNMLLKKAVEWDVIDKMPCTVRLLPIAKPSAGFDDYDDYERLVAAAKALDVNAYLIVLLGGEAGLLCGEIIASNGRTLISESGNYVSNGWNGAATLQSPRVGDYGMSQ